VRNWKDCGLQNLPFEDLVRNMAWVQVSLLAGTLLAWAQMTVLTGKLAKAEPKALRNKILHVAAVLVRRGAAACSGSTRAGPSPTSSPRRSPACEPRSPERPGSGAHPDPSGKPRA